MSTLSGILKIIGGAAEIAGGALIEAGTLGGGTPLALMLIGSGAGLLMGGIGTLLSGNPVTGFATTTRNSVAPWEVCYGECAVGGTIVYMNTWGENDQMLDMVVVLAAHPCQSINEVLFDQQRVQIDTSAIPTSAKAGFTLPWIPKAGSGTSFTPVQQKVNITSIVRAATGVVTVVLSANIPFLTAGDQITIQNVTSDGTLNGTFQVTEIISQTSGEVTFTYLNGGTAVSISSQGQALTRWPDYGRNVYVEYLTGDQSLGTTFAGMTAGTPWQGTGKLCTPASPQNAGGTAAPNPWTNFCSLENKTAVFIRLQYVQKYFPSGIPQISFHLSGKNQIFDPRSSTLGDTSTYIYSTNAALCIADFMTDQDYGFKLNYGTAGNPGTDIDVTQLSTDADTCDESVDLVIGGNEPRYTCNGKFNLEMKRGEILQNLLTCCGGRLTYSSGLYAINPAQWITPISTHVDFQSISAGSMKWSPTISIRDLYNGVRGTYISPDNLWQSTDIPYYAQDANHGYDPGDLLPEYNGDINLAADGGDRRWLDIQLPFTISSATAQRLAKIELMRRRHFGTGTFVCNMKGYQYLPLDVVLADNTFFNWSGKNLEIAALRLRSEKSGDGWLLGTEIDVQETDSSIYDWSTEEELSPAGYVISNYPRNTVVETVCYPWSPGYVSPLTGDAYYQEPASFGMQPVYGQDASFNGTIQMQIKGTAPLNVLDAEIASPLCIVNGLGTGGTLAAGDYVVAVSAHDSGSSPFKCSNYQAFGMAHVPTDGGSITLDITSGAGDDNQDIYLAKWTPFEDGYVFHLQEVADATITSFDETTHGGVDTIFDHFSVLLQQCIHSGPWAQVISAVTASTITIPGPTTASMSTNQWAGYTCSLLAKADPTVEIPYLNMPIVSSTASAGDGTFILTIGTNGNGDTLPDLTTLLAVGDLVSMNFNATFTDTGFSDANIENAFYPGGATGVEAGHVAVVLSGADAGDIQTIASVGGDFTSFTLAGQWNVTPSMGDWVVICNAADVAEIPSTTIVNAYGMTGVVAHPSVLNYANSVWLVRVRAEDITGAYNDDSLCPFRLAYIFGSPGSYKITPQATWVFGINSQNPGVTTGQRSNTVIMKNAGTLTGWDAIAQVPSETTDTTFDITKNGISIMSTPVTLAAGITTLQAGDATSFTGTINVVPGDLFICTCTAMGSSIAAEQVTINLYESTLIPSATS
jgi:hypothetical protein